MKSTESIPTSLAAVKSQLQKDQQKQQEAQNITNQQLENRASESFDMEKLKVVWKEYGKILEQKRRPLQHSIVDKRSFRLENDYTIVITLHSNLENVQLNKLKIDFLPFLKEKLNNYSISLKGEMKALKLEDRKAYTSGEKFEVAAKKHPLLLKMQQIFGLDVNA